jgi:GH25 family lysozyme M1 (1,4-beta-N-acetylmuramidase)
MAIKGIDVSQWQGAIDWKSVKADGVKFVVLREGYRKTVDKYFSTNVKGAEKYNIPVMIYHFIYTDGASIAENAASTVKNLLAAGLDTSTTWVWVDLEYDTWKKNGETCTKETCSKYIMTYIEKLKGLGVKNVGVYANCDYYKNYLTDEVKAYPLWLADYTGGADYPCVMHQYSSSGTVNGINGKVDMNTADTEFWKENSETETGDATVKKTKKQIIQAVKDDAVDFAIKMANDNTHGYSQKVRSLYNIDTPSSFDCSSLVCTAYYYALTKNGLTEQAEYLKKNCSYTGNMLKMRNCGFEVVATNQTAHKKMQKGDIELNVTYHTALAIDAENIVHARSSEGTSDTKDGSGNEIRTQAWYQYSKGWTHRLRFTGKGINFDASDEAVETTDTATSPSKTPQWVGEVTASKLNVRTWAGVNNKPIESWPMLSKGNLVDVCDTVKDSEGNPWYYVRIDGRIYGFVKADYIRKK